MLNDKRTSRKDDLQAITATHEAGHAIAAIFLQQLMPEMVCSVSANAHSTGFTHVEQEHRFISRKILKNRIATKLGGYAAELRVFGEEHLTSGSSNDIKQATEWLAQMLRECGFGPLPGHFAKAGPGLNNSVRDEGEIDREIRHWLQSCLERVQAVLEEQDGLLYQMARYLADHPRMGKSVIRDYCNRFGHGFDPEMIRENGNDGFYRGKVMGL
jgi:cell division protease FtsH